MAWTAACSWESFLYLYQKVVTLYHCHLCGRYVCLAEQLLVNVCCSTTSMEMASQGAEGSTRSR